MAAARKRLFAVQSHTAGIPWWGDPVRGSSELIVNRGFFPLPDTPGLGVKLNEAAFRERTRKGGFLKSTPRSDNSGALRSRGSSSPPRRARIDGQQVFGIAGK
jgi:hypothetical protein